MEPRSFPTNLSSQRWTALRTRNPSANSSFFYGVTSTLIFCRPTCPARLARQDKIIFFENLLAAHTSGYRACKRCDPCNPLWHREMHSRMVFEQARELISTAVRNREEWSVAGVAQKTGVSLGHLHRLFRKFTDVTPKQFAGRIANSRDATLGGIGEALQTTEGCLQDSTLFNFQRLNRPVTTAAALQSSSLDDLWLYSDLDASFVLAEGDPLDFDVLGERWLDQGVVDDSVLSREVESDAYLNSWQLPALLDT